MMCRLSNSHYQWSNYRLYIQYCRSLYLEAHSTTVINLVTCCWNMEFNKWHSYLYQWSTYINESNCNNLLRKFSFELSDNR